MSLKISTPFTVISGGQTGADVAGLAAAHKLGIPTTGWAPKGFKTEKGPKKILQSRYGLIEDESRDYGPRTVKNAHAADITFIFSPQQKSSGTVKTINACIKSGCAYVVYTECNEATTRSILNYLMLMKPMVVNIAGNRESKCRGLSKQVVGCLTPALNSYLNDVTRNGITPVYRHAKNND